MGRQQGITTQSVAVSTQSKSLLCPGSRVLKSCKNKPKVYTNGKPCISCNGDFPSVPVPRKRQDWEVGPSFLLNCEEAVEMQLQALKNNNLPEVDHGVEVLYRFADIDPFARSMYFGQPLDLGQFERFRRILHTPQFSPLLGHLNSEVMASLQVSDHSWRQRVWVEGFRRGEEGVYEFAMQQRFGGRYDGIWFTKNLTYEGSLLK